MKVLVSAYSCEPHKGSEPGLGWNWVRQIGHLHEIWVITRSNNRKSIEAANVKEPLPGIHFVYVDLPRWARFWKKGQRGVHAYYYLWQVCAYFVARRLQRQIGFDLVHHVTIGIYWMPSLLALLPMPFVWGPVGGGESAPPAFKRAHGLRGRAYEALRDLARAMGHLDPFVRLTAERTAMALSKTVATQSRLHSLGCRKVRVCPDSGLSSDEIRQLRALPQNDSNTFRIVSIGNLLHLKGFDLGLKAFQGFLQQFPGAEYWLIGEGPERKRLEHLTRELGVADQVTFWGHMPRSAALEKLADCDVLLHPSLHDSAGWACLEAMAARRPVICLDLHGSALRVTKETGIRVPAISPEQVVRDLETAMSQLASNHILRVQLGQAAAERVEQYFNCDKRGDLLADIYGQIAPVV